MPSPWRIAVIGAGTIAQLQLRVIAKNPDLLVAACCDPHGERARKLLDSLDLNSVPAYADAAAMYAKEKIDAVHICTPSGGHFGPANLAMDHGKHVVIEKPIEIHLDRIDQMIEKSHRLGVRIAGIFQNRWNPANMAIKQAVDENRFGKIAWAGSFTPWYRTDDYYASGAWRGTWKLDGGGAVMNQGIHQVDLMQWIVGPVKSVSALASSRIHAKIEVEDTLTCAMEFQNGAYGSFMSTTAMYPGAAARFEIGGEHGSAVSENGLKRFQFRDARPADEALRAELDPAMATQTGGGSKATDIADELHAQNIAAIYAAWQSGKDPSTDGAEARKAVAIVQAMYESVRKSGVPIHLK